MAGVFISYRRDDTAGEATHLAADLMRALGRDAVFIDIDTISAGVDFVDRIDDALAQCEYVLVLIGDRWLGATDASGARRLDDEQDFVRLEVAKALNAPDVTVVPVLVEGARMPSASALPPELAELTRINAFDLTSKRWRYDVGQIMELIASSRWRGALRRLPTALTIGVPVAVAAVAVVLAIMLSGGNSSPSGVPAQRPEGQLSYEGVGRVSQGTSVDEAIEAFGPPDDRKEVPGCEFNTDDPAKVQLVYNLPDGSLIIYFDSNTQEMVSYATTSQRFPTFAGDRVGDQFASLEANWGTALEYLALGVAEPPADHSGYWEVKDTPRSKLLFSVRADQVKSISGGFLPPCE